MKIKNFLEPIKVEPSMLRRREMYNWKATHGDNPNKKRIDSYLFNREEGYEVIMMIQDIVNHFRCIRNRDVQEIENAISQDLPGKIRSRKDVFDWLVNHFSCKVK